MQKIKKQKIIIWTPRILIILFAVFISLFALDSFDGKSAWHLQLIGFLIHLIPTYLVVGALAVAWKWPRGASGIFLVLGLFYAFMAWDEDFDHDGMAILIISGPLFLIAGLLWWSARCLEKNSFDKREDEK